VKPAEIEVLDNVISAMEKYFPIREIGLFNQCVDILERLKAIDAKSKQRYQDKAEYHREATRKWRQDNKAKHAAYQKQYSAKKRAKKKRNEEVSYD
jgi:hypothetical protein